MGIRFSVRITTPLHPSVAPRPPSIQALPCRCHPSPHRRRFSPPWPCPCRPLRPNLNCARRASKVQAPPPATLHTERQPARLARCLTRCSRLPRSLSRPWPRGARTTVSPASSFSFLRRRHSLPSRRPFPWQPRARSKGYLHRCVPPSGRCAPQAVLGRRLGARRCWWCARVRAVAHQRWRVQRWTMAPRGGGVGRLRQ